jgi:thiol-disulfide isomerase/thioredoxin
MRRLAVLLAAGALALAGCSDGQVERSDNANQAGYIAGDGTISIYDPAERAAAPEFDGELLDGGDFRLADAVGEVVVLNVWGSWCPPCRKEAPDLVAAAKELGAEAVFVGLNTRDLDKAPARKFVREFGVSFPSIYDPSGKQLLGFRGQVSPGAIPSTLVIDAQGNIAARIVGSTTRTTLVDVVHDVSG